MITKLFTFGSVLVFAIFCSIILSLDAYEVDDSTSLRISLTSSGEMKTNPLCLLRVDTRGSNVTLNAVWSYRTNGVSSMVFFRNNGVTNNCLGLCIPGNPYLSMPINGGRILPFVMRRGHATKPEAIWKLESVPLVLFGQADRLRVSDCATIYFNEGKLILCDTSRRPSVIEWRLWSDSDEVLHIELNQDTGGLD